MKEVITVINETLRKFKEKEPERYDRSFQVSVTIKKLVLDDYKSIFGIAGIASKGYNCYITNANGEINFSCDCEDHKKRGKVCKHIFRLLTLLQTFAMYRIQPESRTRIEEIEERLNRLENNYYKLISHIRETEQV